MPTTDEFLPLKSDVVQILLAVAAQPRHGYDVIRDVADRTDGAIQLQTGALYRTLRRLQSDALIQECPRPANADRDDERRRYYRLTTLGHAVLAAEIDRMTRLVRSAKGLAGGKRPRLA